MSEEILSVVRQIWDAVDRGDRGAVFSLYDPDVELDVSGFPVMATDATLYRGHEGLRRLFREWTEIWHDADAKLTELIDSGDGVISVYAYRGRGRASGVSLEREYAILWTIRDGKAVRVRYFLGRDEALKAAGLAE